MQRLTVNKSNRALQREDGELFCYLGDTAWNLIHRLTREEIDLYMRTRAEQGFTAVQLVALTEHDGLDTPNAYGRFPLLCNENGEYDPTLPDLSESDYDYWQHLDYALDKAAEYGLYVALLPTWGDKFFRSFGVGPVLFAPQNAWHYGRWIATRYRERCNLIWVLGGDRPLDRPEHRDVLDAMAAGILASEPQSSLLTVHPCGGASSSFWLQDRDWLSFHMIQSGHGKKPPFSYELVLDDAEKHPIRPVLDAEPCYEDHPIDFDPQNGYFDAFDVRNAAYWNLFSGACGNTYGHHSIWGFQTEPSAYFPIDWKSALHRPGAEQVRHIAALMRRYPAMCCRPDLALVEGNLTRYNYIAACKCRKYALLYIPNGLPLTVKRSKLHFPGQIFARYFSPRTGETLPTFSLPAGQEFLPFTPPSAGCGYDWVLILTPTA